MTDPTLTRAVIIPEFPEGSHEWWIAEAQIEELVRLGGREVRLKQELSYTFGEVWMEVEA